MPLIKRKSDKAFEHNLKAEIHAGKPQKQSLAIAYSVKRRAKKANGGAISASDEKRPMPEARHNDSKEVSHNSGNKPAHDDSWTDKPTERQAMANDVRGKKLPIKRPKMVPTDAFSTRLYDEEGRLEDSASPGPYGAQPPKHDDEDGANRQGPAVPDMAHEHSNSRKPYASGGKVSNRASRLIAPLHSETEEKGQSKAGQALRENKDIESVKDMHHEVLGKQFADKKRPLYGLAEGGSVHDEYNNPSRDDEPSMDEGASMATHRNEEMAKADGKGPDMEREHSNGRMPYARGGEISPMHEEEDEHHSSITAAIMARRQRLHAEIDSGAHDLDEAGRMAEGGEILSHDSIYSDDSDQADLSRNHDEDANEEDQLSFNALRKENYNSRNLDIENPKDSAQMSDDEEADSENKHDTVSAIRAKMKSRRQFKQG
jgi:hypothetical protein